VLFNSFDFVVFLALTYAAYRLLHRWRWPRLLWLLLISLFFYGCWKPWYLVLIALSAFNSYFFGMGIWRARTPGLRKALLAGTVLLDLSLLGVFKYGNFALASAESLMGLLDLPACLPRLETALPVGISFYTFQTLSYTIDLYRRRIEPARNLLEFSVFVAFFPQLVAGPIVRASEFLPQLLHRPRLDRRAVGEGIFLILAGLAKKMIIADLLASWLTTPFFASPAGRCAWESFVVLWAALLQVYCDFSGYSDVAIGAALLFGFRLPLNFDRPLLASSPTEFWRRWHISLSTWLRDYLFIPLGGSRKGRTRTLAAILVTFLLGGLWHGAGWNFLAWGLVHGLILVGWRIALPEPATTRMGRLAGVFFTANATAFAMVFLMADSLEGLMAALRSMLSFRAPSTGLVTPESLALVALAGGLHLSPRSWKEGLRQAFAEAPAYALGLALVLAGGVLSMFAEYVSPFFYFQF